MILRFHFHFKVFSENREKAKWEGDTLARRERERERERGRTQKTQKSPTQIVVPDRVAPQNRSSLTQIVVPNHVAGSSSTQIVVPDRDLAFAPIVIAAPIDFARSCLSLNLVATGLWIFFSGFYLCFWIEEWNYIFVWQLRKCEKMWVISRKCVFYGIFNNTTKHQKIFFTTFFEMQPNTLKIFSFPENKYFPENHLHETNTA